VIWRLGYYLSFWDASLARTVVRRESSGFMRAWKSLINLDNKVPVLIDCCFQILEVHGL